MQKILSTDIHVSETRNLSVIKFDIKLFDLQKNNNVQK